MSRVEGAPRPIHLTEDEAIALLEVCLYAEETEDPARSSAMRKIADLCREHLRMDSAESAPAHGVPRSTGRRSQRQGVWKELINSCA